MHDGPRFSVVIPCKDEADSIATVLEKIVSFLGDKIFEIIVVDDGGFDQTPAALRNAPRQHPQLRCTAHAQSCGKSAAILSGVRAARAPIVVTIDGDGQNDPRHVMQLVALAEQPGVGLAAGQRIKHAHSRVKRLGSRIANGLRSTLLSDETRDTACGLKGFRRDVFLSLPYFDTMHRLLPALVKREGLAVRHLDVSDRPRLGGVSKYGILDRAAASLLDLFGVWWLIHRRRRLPRIIDPDDQRASQPACGE